jgi:hypothetical protein
MGTADHHGRKSDRLLAELPDRSAAGQGYGSAALNFGLAGDSATGRGSDKLAMT